MVLAESGDLAKLGVSVKRYPIEETGAAAEPVEVVGNAVVFNPEAMELNKFYLAELNGAPYIYRRVSAGEVEVYGLAG